MKTVVICGPTASGKTALAIELAARIGGEIISADSMQVYRGMDVGTAKPSDVERRETPFHLIDVVDPDEPFTVSLWKELATEAMSDIRRRGRFPILCGGTGMYLRALLRNWTMAETPRDDQIRSGLESDAERMGSAELHSRLEKIDPETAKRLHPNDSLRIIRALEVYLASGTPLSAYHRRDQDSRVIDSEPQVLQFGLDMSRHELYRRIDYRVDCMVEMNFENEVRGLLEHGYGAELPSMNSLGYKEMCGFLNGSITRETAIEQIKTNTRRYAKRQLTWFRAEPEITWVDYSTIISAEVVDQIQSSLSLA